MRALILAAGYGTRLYPLTLNLPKALISINKKPLINFLIEKTNNLKKYFSIEEIIVVSNNRFYKKFLGWKRKYKIKADILNDGTNSPLDRLGAVKDMEFAIKDKKDDWLILGADNLFEDNLVDFLKFSLKKIPHPSLAIYDIKSKKVASRFGVVEINSRRRIKRLSEKPKRSTSTLIATCVYFFPKDSLKFLSQFLLQYKEVDTLGKYIEWLVKKTKVYAYFLKGKWIDIGQLDSLRKAWEIFK
jgi:glucose-1-phosphate thymidylyltransferase